MPELENEAVRKRKYPLNLPQREIDAIRISQGKLASAGVREVEFWPGFKTHMAFKADGVGTKILIAEAMGVYDTVGIDAVAMTVNDVICVGARPVMLVDYLAQNKDDSQKRQLVVDGVKKGCTQANVDLVGGETATIGDIISGYGDGYHFDLATACFGIVGDGGDPIAGDNIRPDDIVIGLRSSGLHSNGFLWARPQLLKEFRNDAPYSLDWRTPEGLTLGEEFLKPTLIYVEPVLRMIENITVKGVAHITGGAFRIKLPRIAPQGISFVLDNMPEPQWIFKEIQKQSQCPFENLFEAFNMGIGMVVVIDKEQENDGISIANECGFEAQRIGYARSDDRSRVYIPSKNIIYDKVEA